MRAPNRPSRRAARDLSIPRYVRTISVVRSVSLAQQQGHFVFSAVQVRPFPPTSSTGPSYELGHTRKRAVIVVSGGLENKQTGRMFKTALEVAVANDKIARRHSGLAERLAGDIA